MSSSSGTSVIAYLLLRQSKSDVGSGLSIINENRIEVIIALNMAQVFNPGISPVSISGLSKFLKVINDKKVEMEIYRNIIKNLSCLVIVGSNLNLKVSKG